MIPRVPKALLSSKIKQNIRKAGWQIDSGKRSNILPALRLISDVLTWKRPLLTTLVVGFLVFRVTMALMHMFFPNEFVTMFIWLMRNAGTIVLFAAVVVSFIIFAQP